VARSNSRKGEASRRAWTVVQEATGQTSRAPREDPKAAGGAALEGSPGLIS
jgi:hypothetical protein